MIQQAINPIMELPKKPIRSKNVTKVATKITLLSNHFPIDFIDAKQTVYVYAFEFSPVINADARTIRDQVMKNSKKLIQEQGLKNFTIRGKNLWSPIEVKERIIVASADDKGTPYSIRIEKVKEISFNDFTAPDETTVAPLKQSVNVAIKRVLKELGLVEIGRLAKYFNPQNINKNKLPQHGLTVWRGFKTTLQVYQGKPYIQIDFASRVLRDETARDYINALPKQNLQDIIYEMSGLSVLATYGNYRLYRIDNLDFQQNPNCKFTLEDGKQVTYAEYYKSRYNVVVKDMKQPLIVSVDRRNPDKKLYLIPELVKMTGITDAQKKNFGLMKDLAQYTKLEPFDRNKEILSIHVQLQKALQQHNVSMKTQPTIVGHLLNPPVLQLGQGKKLATEQSGFFILKDNVYKQSYIKDWFLVYEGRGKRDDENADDLVGEIRKAGGRIGIKIDAPYFIVINNNQPRNWIKEIEEEFKKGLPQMVVSFTSDRGGGKGDEPIYTALKRLCLQKFGVSHQNILLKFSNHKNKPSVAVKIAQQMSVKLGAPLWVVPRVPGISDRVLVIGIDIYHKLIDQRRSCMGFVAHFDAECQSTYSRSILMRQGQEMNQEMGRVFQETLEAYFKYHEKKFLPDTIIVYRDGVGMGQVNALCDTEIAQMKQIIQSLGANYKPQLAVIMINKKISDRFFAKADDLPQQMRRNNPNPLLNPPSGTVVADVVTTGFDFFLAAQYVTQGTCTPTHFRILENSTDWPEEVFWQFTYNQCFNYQNWSGAVRVPACVQYAHKMAFMIGDTFQSNIHEKLMDKLCYL